MSDVSSTNEGKRHELIEIILDKVKDGFLEFVEGTLLEKLIKDDIDHLIMAADPESLVKIGIGFIPVDQFYEFKNKLKDRFNDNRNNSNSETGKSLSESLSENFNKEEIATIEDEIAMELKKLH